MTWIRNGVSVGTRLSRVTTAVAVLAPLVFGLIVLKAGFGIAWDFLNYHFYDGFAVFHDRSRDIAPAGLHTYFNPAAEIPFYLSAVLLPPWLAGVLFGVFSGLNLTLTYFAARAALRGPNAWLPAILCAVFAVTSTNFAIELASVNHDDLVSLFFLAGLILLLQASLGGRLMARVAGAGVIIGMGVGLKYTLAPFLVGTGAFLPLLFRGHLRWRKLIGVAIVFAAAALAGALITAGWWMLHLWRDYGNPFFPMFNGFFRSPWAAPASYADHRFLPRGLLQQLAYPFFFARDAARAGVKMPVHDYRYLVAYLGFIAAAVICVVQRVRQAGSEHAGALMPRNIAWFLIFMSATSYIVWQMAFSVSRYLFPLDVLLPLVGLAWLEVLGFTSWRWVAAWAGGFAVLALTASHPLDVWTPWTRRLMAASVPPIAHPPSTMIVLAGTAPMSYMIPAFPPQVRFVRISLKDGFDPAASGGITALDSDALLARQARAAVASHNGDLYVMYGTMEKTKAAEDAVVAQTLRGLKLQMVDASCRPVLPTLRYIGEEFRLCALRHQA